MQHYFKVGIIPVLTGLFVALLSGPIGAYQVTLEDKNFDLTGARSQKRMVIINNEPQPIAVEVGVKKRSIDINGVETEGDVPDGWFIIYPSQLLLNPGEEEVVRIAWMNKVKVTTEMPFRFVVSQIKLLDPEEVKRQAEYEGYAAKVDFVTRYVLAAYVKPPGMVARVILDDPEVITTANGLMVRLTFHNTGNSRRGLGDLKLTIYPLKDNGAVNSAIPPAEFPGVETIILLGGGSRMIELPLPKAFEKTRIRAEYTCKSLD